MIRNLSTAVLGFVAGKFDMTFSYSLTVPLLNDAKSQLPEAICELTPGSINRNLLINRDKPPFDNPDLRHAMALSLDRRAFIDNHPGTARHWRGHAAGACRLMGHAAGDAQRTAGL